MRTIDADVLKIDIVEEGQRSRRYKLGEIWELNRDEIYKVIDKQPTIESEPLWIPCSERLPEANGRYLVTRGLNACGSLWNRIYIANYSDLMGLKSERIWWNGNVGKSDFERIDDVIAWMPLPEPYKEWRCGMSLIEEKTLADHDINVRSIRQELQLLEKQLKKHGKEGES